VPAGDAIDGGRTVTSRHLGPCTGSVDRASSTLRREGKDEIMGTGWTPGQASELSHRVEKPDTSCEELDGTITGAEPSAEAGGLCQIVPAVWIMVKWQTQNAQEREVARMRCTAN
jgi:hypothetical protein